MYSNLDVFGGDGAEATQAVIAALQRQGLSVEPEAVSALSRFIGGGTTVARVEAIRQQGAPPGTAELAANLEQMTRALVAEAQRQRTTQITASMVEHVKQIICPLWPFC